MNNSTPNPNRARSLCALIFAANASILTLPLLAQSPGKPASKPAAPAPAARPATGAAAEVNGEKILNADIDRRLARIRAAQPALQGDSAEARQALQQIRGAVVEDAIDDRLRVQEAKKQKIAPLAAQIDASVAEVRKKFGLTTDAQAKEFMAREGKGLADMRQFVTERLMVSTLESRWLTPVAITENEIAEAYRANIANYSVPEGVRARHILIAFKTKAPGPADKAQARQKAEDVLRQAKAPGADFGTLAKANSDDTGSKDKGGDLGPFPRGLMIEPFEKAAFAAKPGEIVGPIETVFGYHIIKVESKIAARILSLDEMREELRGPLLQAKREQTLEQKLQALRTAAKIKKNA